MNPLRQLRNWLARRAAQRRELQQLQLEARAADLRGAEARANPGLPSLARLLHWWQTPPSDFPAEEIDALEARLGVSFPADFRAYLQAVMPDGNHFDDEGTRWWPLADIKTVRQECGDKPKSALNAQRNDLIVFADFLIWCYAWAIDCSQGLNRGRVAVIGGKDRYIADSFDDFLDCYLRDETAIHG